MNEEHTEKIVLRFFKIIASYIKDKPGALAIFFYTYVALTGLLYNFVYFYFFNVDVLQYYELNDFLLSGLKQPIILILPFAILIATMLFVWFIALLDRLLRQFRRRLAKSLTDRKQTEKKLAKIFLFFNRHSENFEKHTEKWIDPYVIPFSIIYSLFISSGLIVIKAANDFNDVSLNDESHCVYLNKNNNPLTKNTLSMIGSTRETVFFFDLNKALVHIIPRKEILFSNQNQSVSRECEDIMK